MTGDISLKDLPDSLKPIKPLDWKNACDWINARWGKTSWNDDTVLYEDARFWCKEELDGGLQYCLQKGGGFPPTFAELTKSVMEWRNTHLAHRLAEFDKKLPAPRGSLRDYLNNIGAESFAHACYLNVQERVKYGKLGKHEDETLYNNWTDSWDKAKETYMPNLQSKESSFDISEEKYSL